MKNIFLVLLPDLFCYVVSTCYIVYYVIKKLIKKPAHYWLLKILMFVAMSTYLIIADIPFYMDIAEQKTNVVTAEYISFQATNTLPCTHKLHFDGDNGAFSVYTSIFNRDPAKMDVGKTYEIEYYVNSNTIKSYKLIE